MAIFLTGSTGYIGSYVVAGLLKGHPDQLNLLVRAQEQHEAAARLWRACQLHMEFPRFQEYLESRLCLFRGDLTQPRFGLNEADYGRLAETTDSIIHCAATLNRRSEKSCLNVNLRGTLEVIQLALRARERNRLRRFSHVSTVSVAGQRQNDVVREDEAIDWARSDYDPYARTKKFSEHMIRQLLPDVPKTIFRPSIVLGDSHRSETTQFDMARTFAFFADLPLLPFRPADRLDIVPVNFVADSIVALHQKEKPQHEIYHLSAGTASETYRQMTDKLAAARRNRHPIYLPSLQRPLEKTVDFLANRRGSRLGSLASLLKVFLPYLVWNTVFDNSRVTGELGRIPAPFSSYCYPLLKFSRETRFTFPYQEWPQTMEEAAK